MLRTLPPLRNDPRVEQVLFWDHADTPITMTRNASVLKAKQLGVDVLVMIDSDNLPDFHLTEGNAYGSPYPMPRMKPFFATSFDYLYQHYHDGPVMIGAPYCGPAPHRPVYTFKWTSPDERDNSQDLDSLEQMTRLEGSSMRGIGDVAAIATGCLMIDMRIFKFEPDGTGFYEPPWFYYEWQGNGQQCEYCEGSYAALVGEEKRPWHSFQHEKASTEDVVFSRNVSLLGQTVLGYNPVKCNWDAWAGHLKLDPVGAPIILGSDQVSKKLLRAGEAMRTDEMRVVLGEPGGNGNRLSKVTVDD